MSPCDSDRCGPSPRFHPAALKRLAGDAVYERGAAYARQDRVRILSIGFGKVHAVVRGSEQYRATVEGEGGRIGGSCDCPAFQDWGFCKHLVAVALTVNGMAPAAITEAVGRTDRLRAHLTSQPSAVLADRLLHWAERDPALRRELELELELQDAPDEVLLRRLWEEIDQVTAVEGYLDWRGAASLADDVRTVVTRIEALSAAGRIGVALGGLDHLLDGADSLLEEVDDSDGEVYGAIEEALALHLLTCRAAGPDGEALARQLFERQTTSGFDFWSQAHADYAEVLGAAGLAEYRRLAEAAWEARPPGVDRHQVRAVLDFFALKAGDVDARIALRAAVANTAADYLELAELCLGARRESEALAWAEEGLWKCEDRPDRRLTILAADLRRSSGDPAKAEALLWTAFERAPSLELHRLIKQTAADPPAAVERAVGIVEARAARDVSPSSGARALLLDLLLEEGRPGQAWEAARSHGCSDSALERLARTTEGSHPREAIDAYVRLIQRNVERTGNEAYAKACGLLARAARLRIALGEGGEQARHVLELRERHKAKRNFIRLLDDPAAWPDR